MPGKVHPNGDREPLDAAIARIAARQFGLLSLTQLFVLGLTYAEVEERVRLGRLHRLHRGVYAVGHTNIVPHGRLLAALLTFGPGAFLSHRTAAAVWGLREISTRRIEVTVQRSGGRPRDGVQVHGTRRAPDVADLAVRNGLRLSSVPRLLIELALREHPNELDRLITQAVRKRIFDADAMEAALLRHERRPGLGALKAALAAYRPKPQRRSGFEIAFGIWEIDCYWPRQKFVIELDGRSWARCGKGSDQGHEAAAREHSGHADHRTALGSRSPRDPRRRLRVLEIGPSNG